MLPNETAPQVVPLILLVVGRESQEQREALCSITHKNTSIEVDRIVIGESLRNTPEALEALRSEIYRVHPRIPVEAQPKRPYAVVLDIAGIDKDTEREVHSIVDRCPSRIRLNGLKVFCNDTVWLHPIQQQEIISDYQQRVAAALIAACINLRERQGVDWLAECFTGELPLTATPQ